MNPQTTEAVRPQSTFVTVTAWFFIVAAGFSTVISVMQNIMINTMFPLDELRSAADPGSHPMPPFAKFMTSHVQTFFLAFLCLSVAMLVSAIALLRRRNWARIAFISIFGLGIAWNIAVLVLQQFLFSSMPNVTHDTPPGFDARFDQMMAVMRVFSFAMAVTVSVLFGWLIKRLMSPSIRSEFT